MNEYVHDELMSKEDTFIISTLIHNDIDNFRKVFFDLHPYEQAQFFVKLDKNLRMKLYEYVSPKELAVIFENLEVEENEYEIFLMEMNPNFVADMLAHMYTDDAVDVLNELKKDQVANFLTIMNEDAAQEIKDLLHYDEYTAGSIMTTEFISILANQTVRSAMYILKNEASSAEMIYYLFVVNEDKQLVGVLSLRDLLVADDDKMISEIMNDRVISVSVAEDQEEVAKKMKDYNFVAIPVVDFQQHLIGIITVDDIIDVIDEEASDDYSKLAAVSDVTGLDRNPINAAKKRLPWLIILLFLGMLTASLIGRFEEILSKVTILAIFIPVIAGMAGNTGTQALAIAVRGIATGEIDKENKGKLILKEAGTGVITGLVCGILIAVVVYLWKNDIYLGLLVGTSVLFTLMVATIAGAFIPLFMHKLKIDPAVASGPFITTINDIISILVYFGMASLFIKYLL